MLPRAVEELTPEWLTTALSLRAPGTVVEDVETESVIWGTATKVFVRPSYSDRPDDGPAAELCIKGCFQEELRSRFS
jgi:hypothetical protein